MSLNKAIEDLKNSPLCAVQEESIVTVLAAAIDGRLIPADNACVEVKPLEWRDSYGVMRAETPFGDYMVTRKIWKIGSGMSGERVSENPCDDAQADYEQRIRSALEVRPQPEQCVEVKPLEWDHHESQSFNKPAPFLDWGRYKIHRYLGDWCLGEFTYPNRESAIVAAQADYEQRIRSALTIRSIEDVRREALEEAAMQVEAVAGNDAMWVADAIRDLNGKNHTSSWEERICTICDGGPGNHGACLCGHEKWDTPAPSREEECQRCGSYGYGCYECTPEPQPTPSSEPVASQLIDELWRCLKMAADDHTRFEKACRLYRRYQNTTPQPDELRQAKAEAWREGCDYASQFRSSGHLKIGQLNNPYAAPDEGGGK